MELIEKTENRIVFKAKTNETLANSLRRSLNRIPIRAVDELKISKNDSSLYDETVAHRIGLIPLKTPKNVKGDEVLKLKLKVKKPGFVYSGDIKGDGEIVYDGIPILLLNEAQEVNIEMSTRIGTGEEHAKFSPGLIYYRNAYEITLDSEFLGEIKRVFPENTIKTKGSKIVVLDDKAKSALDFCEALVERNGKKAELKWTGEIIFTIESFGQLDVTIILEKALEVLEKDLKSFIKALK